MKRSDLGIFLLIVVLIAFGCWWQVYRYRDCKRVGHTTLYCILSAGR